MMQFHSFFAPFCRFFFARQSEKISRRRSILLLIPLTFQAANAGVFPAALEPVITPVWLAVAMSMLTANRADLMNNPQSLAKTEF